MTPEFDINLKAPFPYFGTKKTVSEIVWKYLGDVKQYIEPFCGSWDRLCGGNWQADNAPCGMFFDPPYATEGRDEDIYHHDSMTVGKEVEAWCLERGHNPDYRIVAAGYDDEYKSLVEAGWHVHSWSSTGGYARITTAGTKNRHRERLYVSPYCNVKDNMGLFAEAER